MEFLHVSKSEDEWIVSGVVLQGTPAGDNPIIDSQGEWYSEEVVRKAAQDLMEKGKVCFDVQHSNDRCFFFDVIESFVADEDMLKWNMLVKRGAWIATVHIDDERVWKLIKDGTLNSFSVAGTAEV